MASSSSDKLVAKAAEKGTTAAEDIANDSTPRPSTSPAFVEHLDLSSPAASPAASFSPRERFRRSVDLVRTLSFWKHLSQEQEQHDPPPPHISSTARTVYILLTGQIPQAPSPPPAKLNKKARHVRGTAPQGGDRTADVMIGYLSDAPLSDPEVHRVGVKGYLEDVHDHEKERKGARTSVKKVEANPVPNVSNKALKKAKRQLVNPNKARRIITDLTRMEIPVTETDAVPTITPSSTSDLTTTEAPPITSIQHPHSAKGYALPPLSSPTPGAPHPPATATAADLPFTLISLTSPGTLGAIGAQQSGAFRLLADISGALVKKSGTHEGLIAPSDRIGIFIWYWGFELTIPPSEMVELSYVHSIQSTVLNFLNAMMIAGGAIELVPYTRYISSYLDMEWGAIKSQDRGHGVIVAATWLLPVALIPRPWDFAIPPPGASPPTPPIFEDSSGSFPTMPIPIMAVIDLEDVNTPTEPAATKA